MQTYSGHVEPGGAAAYRVLPEITIAKRSVGPANNNAYLVVDNASQRSILIDAAADPERLIELIGDTSCEMIVTTHRHPDHWQALGAVLAATGAQTVAHPDDAEALPVYIDTLVREHEHLVLGAIDLEVLHLVGHTPGSIALHYEPEGGHLFTGDSLFPGGVGKTNSPGAFASLIDDVESKLFDYMPDSTWVYPGHGDDTTLGNERPQLAQWRERGW